VDFLLAIAKIMALFSSILVFVSSPHDVRITHLEPEITSGYLTLSARLENGFPEALDEVILSGTVVTLRFKITLLHKKRKIKALEVLHQVKYDLSEKKFIVFFSETDTQRQTHDLETVHKWMSELRCMKIVPLKEVRFGEEYLFLIEASLDEIKVIGGQEGKFDLMVLWKNVTPKASRKVSFD
jgi:hypothetical protein